MQVATQSWTGAEGKVKAAGPDATQMEIRPRRKCQSAATASWRRLSIADGGGSG